MPLRWPPAALAALRESGPAWLALVRLVRQVTEIGERCWSVDLLESRGALPPGPRRRRTAHFTYARLSSADSDLAPGALLAIGGGAARALAAMLWVEVASPVTSEAEGRAFLDDCERALDAFVPEPSVPIDSDLVSAFYRCPPGDRWAGVLFPLPVPVEGGAHAHFAGDDPEHLSIQRALVVSLPDLREGSQACIAFGVLVRDAAGPRAAAAAFETDEAARALFLLRARAAMRALAGAGPVGSADAPDRSFGAAAPARPDRASRVTLRLLSRPAEGVAHARVESVADRAMPLCAGDFVTVSATDDASRHALLDALTPIGRSGIAEAIKGESRLPGGARRRLLDATLTPADGFGWSLSAPTVREAASAGVLLPCSRDLGAGALDPARVALGESGSAAAAVETPGADYEGHAGVVVWVTDDAGLGWRPLPMAADQTWNPLRRCYSWPPAWLDAISLSGGVLAIEWEDPWMFEPPTHRWRAAFDPVRGRWRIQRRPGE
jgi:hypothetical protein